MRHLRQFAACLLLALWLPAMLHCDLEAANVHLAHNAHDATQHTGCAGTNTDSCHPIESAAYTAALPSLKVPPPADHLSALFAALAHHSRICIEPDLSLSPKRHPPPPELRVRWQFTARAAPPPRAPSSRA